MVYMVKLVDTPQMENTQKEASKEDPASRMPASKEDIEHLADTLAWPPPFTRDIRLQKMQRLLKQENEVMNDPTLSDTEKVLRVAECKQQYNVQNKELFQPRRLSAVPPKPLPPPVDIKIADKTESEDFADSIDSDDYDYSDDSDVSFETVIARDPVRWDEDDDNDDEEEWEEEDAPDQTPFDYTPAGLLKMVKPYRRAKTALMLKKLAADDKLKWDAERGNVFYRGDRIPYANIGELVAYFQSAHKKHPMPLPAGHVIFAQALRKAHATEDVQLGGPTDDEVRSVFTGHTPKTPRFATTNFKRVSPRGRVAKVNRRVRFSKALKSPPSSRRPTIKRKRQEGDKPVSTLEL